MSGRHAMAVRIDEGLGDAADARLNDVCLVFSEILVRMAGAVIAGVKPAAIFTLPMRAFAAGKWRQLSRRALDEALRAYAEALPAYGVELSVLYRTDRRVYLLVWRPDDLDRVLADPAHLLILREQGYCGAGRRELLGELRRRLVDYYLAFDRGERTEFPHEIGVFLGYPSEDVRGFMAGEKATCSGAWHAYGDEQVAKRRFRMLEMHERRCRSRFASGEPLHALFA